MGARQKQWARRERARLIGVLGGKCVDCGAVDDLEFDCIYPMGHDHHPWESSARISFYRGQLAAGNLALRCKVCNGRKGNGERIGTRAKKAKIAARLLELAWPVDP